MLCKYQDTIYHNKDNGFCIVIYETSDNTVPQDARKDKYGKFFTFTAKGYNLPMVSDIDIEINGNWKEEIVKGKNYGKQLNVDSFRELRPTSKDGIISFLSSGLVKGIGEKTAQQIYDRFKDKSLDILEKNPQKLLEISGITEQKLTGIIESYNEHKSMQDIVSFLSPYGISVNKASKIKSHFGARSYEIISRNPFELCAISGFGFDTVDKIARAVKCSLTEPLRVRSGIKFIFQQEASSGGHLFLTADYISGACYEILNKDLPQAEVSIELIKAEINNLIKCRELMYEKSHKAIYLANFYKYESNTAEKIAHMLNEPASKHDTSKYILQAQKELNIILSEGQVKAVEMCINNNFSIITGGPGTGKTTVLIVVLYIYGILFKGKTVMLCAPTGRASRRMAESTGYELACTLHSALGLVADSNNEFIDYSEDLDADFIIVDETSMVDMFLGHELITKVKRGAKLLFVGDADQLPSIGAGNVFRELLNCECIPKTILKMIYRQEQDSLIPLNAKLINSGETGLQFGEDFVFIECEDDEKTAEATIHMYTELLKTTDIQELQILTPRKDRAKTGAKEINGILRDLVNPEVAPKRQIKVGNRIFREQDRIMQTKNIAPISNGDIGVITRIYKNSNNEDLIVIDFDGRVVEYTPDNMEIILHSYAITIHKSQGSEYETVIIPITGSSYRMQKRNLIYTAITRAKRKVYIIGQKNALYKAIKTNDIDRRNTYLGARVLFLYNNLLTASGSKEQQEYKQKKPA